MEMEKNLYLSSVELSVGKKKYKIEKKDWEKGWDISNNFVPWHLGYLLYVFTTYTNKENYKISRCFPTKAFLQN